MPDLTKQELIALQEFEPVRYEIQHDQNGDVVQIPHVSKREARLTGPDSLMAVVDSDGVAWRPVKSNNRWYKEKVIL